MQWIALDGQVIVPASTAIKQRDYLCPECLSPVRLRAGFHRQRHFYHLRASFSCKQHQKTFEHLQAQLLLARLGKEQGARIEQPFPEIQRIADIALWDKRIAIEIQVSPISLEEVQARLQDYHSIGWRMVWILHERSFNRKSVSPAEHYLRTHAICYFTNLTRHGTGFFYDQFELLRDGTRYFKGHKLPVIPYKLALIPKGDLFKDAPQCIRVRGTSWAFFAHGDLFSCWLKDRDAFGQQLLFLEKTIFPFEKKLRLSQMFLQFYSRAIKKGALRFARKD